jgi:hypothetical protein
LRSALRTLGQTAPVVLLERGSADALESWAHETGAAALTAFRLWTERLGRQARPPSRLPFRFIERRMQFNASAGLYVGVDDGVLDAARRAGFPTWNIRTRPGNEVPGEITDAIDWLGEPLEDAPDARP